MKYLNDFAEGERVIAFCLVKSKEVAVASNQSEYLNLELGDKSGSLPAKMWDVPPELKETVHIKTIVKIDGVVQSYRGKKQLVIQRMRLAVPADEIEMESLIPVSSFPVDELSGKLHQFLAKMHSEQLRAIVTELFADADRLHRLQTYPAGVKMHHNYYHGLLEHVVSLLTLAETLQPLYPHVDKDVLFATCMLHDIGKLYELSDAIAPEYTTQGQLIGHLVIGVELVNTACSSLGLSAADPDIMHLKHCILSHHGDVEQGWGSAVSGKTPTAVLFHYLDQIDSKMNALRPSPDDEAEEWSYSPALRRKIWRGY